MRLSEAIMLGSTLMKPLRGVFRTDDGSEGCAYGMADVAGLSFDYPRENIPSPCVPACGCNFHEGEVMGGRGDPMLGEEVLSHFSNVIVHLFNQHVCATPEEVATGIQKWSIEQLCDWIREQEDKLEAKQRAKAEAAKVEAAEYTAV